MNAVETPGIVTIGIPLPRMLSKMNAHKPITWPERIIAELDESDRRAHAVAKGLSLELTWKHQFRHLQQAERVKQAPGFPGQ